MLEESTIEEDAIVFSRFSVNLIITELLSEWQIVSYAIEQGVLQRRTSQNSLPHLPFDLPQTLFRFKALRSLRRCGYLLPTLLPACKEIAGHIPHACQNMLGQIPAGVDLTQPDS